MGNFFSSDGFLRASASILMAGRGCQPATVQVQGSCFRVLRAADGRVVLPPLADFYEPVDHPAGTVETADYIERVGLGSRPASPGTSPPAGATPAPYIDWSCHESWQHFVDTCTARNSRAFRRSPRRIRRLSREFGEVRFSIDGTDHDLLERALLWKSRQLRHTGGLDHFCSVRNRQLLHHLVAAEELQLAAFSAGDHTLAAILIHVGPDRLCCWISTYDPRFARHSPGTLLFEHLMKHSFDQQHRRFDFLIGDEAYKYYYATHELLVHPLGRPRPLQAATGQLRHVLDDRAPPALEKARKRIRRAAVASLQQRICRNGLAGGDADPHLDDYKAAIRQHQPGWPRARVQQPADCQLQVLIQRAEADAGPLRTRLYQLQHSGRRVRAWVDRRTGAPPPPPAPSPPGLPRPLKLAAGDRVRIRPVAKIRATLTDRRCEGLYYIPEVMDRHAGQVFEVDRPVGQFYDERGRQIRRSRHSVLLRDVLCDGSQLHDARGCDRACPVFWHEAWLERVDAEERDTPPDRTAPRPRPVRARPTHGIAVGQRVRVRPPEQIVAPDAGIAFVPQVMAPLAGQVFTVRNHLALAYDERLGRVFDVGDAVVLEGVHCPGVALTDGGRCDRRCALFWLPEWLEPADSPAPATRR